MDQASLLKSFVNGEHEQPKLSQEALYHLQSQAYIHYWHRKWWFTRKGQDAAGFTMPQGVTL